MYAVSGYLFIYLINFHTYTYLHDEMRSKHTNKLKSDFSIIGCKLNTSRSFPDPRGELLLEPMFIKQKFCLIVSLDGKIQKPAQLLAQIPDAITLPEKKTEERTFLQFSRV